MYSIVILVIFTYILVLYFDKNEVAHFKSYLDQLLGIGKTSYFQVSNQLITYKMFEKWPVVYYQQKNVLLVVFKKLVFPVALLSQVSLLFVNSWHNLTHLVVILYFKVLKKFQFAYWTKE